MEILISNDGVVLLDKMETIEMEKCNLGEKPEWNQKKQGKGGILPDKELFWVYEKEWKLNNREEKRWRIAFAKFER